MTIKPQAILFVIGFIFLLIFPPLGMICLGLALVMLFVIPHAEFEMQTGGCNCRR